MTTAPVTLAPGCHAEHDTCGSCKFFDRDHFYGDDYRMYGKCTFVLPPLMKLYVERELTESEREWGPRKRRDDDRCDLYRCDGRTYIVQRKIVPPEQA